MNIPLTSMLEAGIAIRMLRKGAGIRIDDFAMTAVVSKQFMTDLENGKPAVQMGKVLLMLQRLRIKVGLELPTADVPAFQLELNKVRARRAILLKGASDAAPLQTAALEVQNMTCGLCPVTVKKSLECVAGVRQARMDFAKKTAIVTFDANKTNATALVKATTDAGYPSTVHK